jgi:mannose-6-phosphate isomerase class I
MGQDRPLAILCSACGRIGEVWFTDEQYLPLLVKFLFTSERLSVQVHPADGEAARGARPRCGIFWKPSLTPESQWVSANS